MRWTDFVKSVERWARVRGIYEQSTEDHQKAKALEELGEYLVARNIDELRDAIGDIAVCVVNAAYIYGLVLDENSFIDDATGADLLARDIVGGDYNACIQRLKIIALENEVRFEDCLDQAWESIKDRKGMMINGLYVKWDNLTPEQRSEFNERDYCNTLLRK